MLNFLYIAISWVLLRWHDLFKGIGLDPAGGLSWALAIFMLVVTIRILLFRFFIKQVHSQRKMQEVQPKIAALREKYKNDRQTLSQEMMKLQKEEGFNPLSGCLPVLMQAPVFIALFHVLRVAADDRGQGALVGEYGWTPDQADQAEGARLFGAPIAAAFRTATDRIIELGGTVGATRVVAGALIVLMVAATYITQRQIIARSSQTQVIDGQQAMIQKLLLYGMPASLFISGFLFPIGVLLYWFTNNLWTMGQQFYILKRMPHPSAKKDERDPAVAKALAPKPGQKPVRPERRAAAADGMNPDAASPDGATRATGTAPKPGAKPAPGAKPTKGKAADGRTAGKPGGRTAGKPASAASAGATSDGAGAGGATPGGVASGGATADGAASGGATRGGAAPGGPTAGGVAPGGAGADGVAAGGLAPGGAGADAVAAGGAASGGASAEGAASGGPDGAAAGSDAGDGAAGGSGATPAGAAPTPRSGGSKPGGGRPSGGGRRPSGQRSPTQTRQKKKRR